MGRALGVALVAAASVVAPAAVLAGANGLKGTVGPDFTIGLGREDGSRVINLDPGAYNLGVDDQSEFHSFHLRGPGVDVATGIEFIGVQDFDLTLGDGRYEFFCDAHPVQMRGTFTVGTPPPPPPAPQPPPPPPPPPARLPRLAGSVGAAAISLKRAGVNVKKTLRAGTYLLTVTDRSSKNNFHLTGRGINRKTGIAAKPRVTWRVVLRRGAVYTFRSDADPKLKKSFRAV
jgi:hypothetical protein